MHHSHLPLRKSPLCLFVSLFKCLEVELFVLLDEGINDVDLPSAAEFHLHALAYAFVLARGKVPSGNGFASRWQLVDDAHVKVAVDGHGQGAWNGRGRHDEDVWRPAVFGPQLCALLDAEAVLLVDDGESEVAELHVRLYEGVRADENLNTSLLDAFEGFAALFPLDIPGEERHVDANLLHLVAESAVMLFGKNFGRSHDARLEAVVDGKEGHQCGDDGLARTHIALQQAVHLVSRLQVGMYLPDDAFLRLGEAEGQHVAVEGVELLGDAREAPSLGHRLPRAGILQDGELEEEEFLEFQSAAGIAHRFGTLAEVDVADGLFVAHQPVGGDEVGREGLGDGGNLVEGVCHQLVEELRGDAPSLQLLGQMIDGLHAEQRTVLHLLHHLHFGMWDAEAVLKHLRLAEHLVGHANLTHLADGLQTAEPDEGDESRAVGEGSHQASLGAFAYGGDVDNLSA